MPRYVLALDQGTTSSRAILFDRDGAVRGVARRDLPQHHPAPGLVEHDAEDLWTTLLESAREVLATARATAADVAAIGVANQRETTLLWDRATGRALHPAIVWQCRRTAPQCERLRRRGLEPGIRRRTGLLLDPYFSATKLAWLLDAAPDARRRARRGELAFGTVDTWLLWRLTGGAVHATDPSNASRTLLYDLRRGVFDDGLLKTFGVPRPLLPEIRPSSGSFGTTDPAWFGGPVPITGVAGDQQASLYGHGALRPGDLKNTYGTGGFLLVNAGERPPRPPRGLLATVAWRKDGRTTYALEGSVFVAGAAVRWLRDALSLFADAAETSELAASLPSNEGVRFVPAFVGLGAPHWDPDARGALFGLTRGTGRAHLARAALEAIAYQTRDLVEATTSGSGLRPRELRVDGGAARNDFLCAFQADLLGIPVVRPVVPEATALGAALLAGEAVGFYDARGPAAARAVERRFEPRLSRAARDRLYAGWLDAVRRVRSVRTPRRRS